MESTKKDHEKMPQHIEEEEQFAEDFLAAIRRVWEEGNYVDTPNHHGAWYYIGTKYTAFYSPVFIKTITKNRLNSSEYSFLNKDDNSIVLDVQSILTRKKICRVWGCEKKAVWKMFIGPVEKGKAPHAFMFLDNKKLWGDAAPPIYNGEWAIVEGEKFAWVEKGSSVQKAEELAQEQDVEEAASADEGTEG